MFQLPKTRNHLHLRPASCRSTNQSLIAQWINRFRSFPASKYLHLSSIPIFSTPVLPTIFLIYIDLFFQKSPSQAPQNNAKPGPTTSTPRLPQLGLAVLSQLLRLRQAVLLLRLRRSQLRELQLFLRLPVVATCRVLGYWIWRKMEKWKDQWKYQWNSWIGKMTDLNFGISSEN